MHWHIIVSTDICLLFYSIPDFKYLICSWNEEYKEIYYLSLRGYLQERLYCHAIFLSSLIGDKNCISLELSCLILKFWVFNFLFELVVPWFVGVFQWHNAKGSNKKQSCFSLQQISWFLYPAAAWALLMRMYFHCDTESV